MSNDSTGQDVAKVLLSRIDRLEAILVNGNSLYTEGGRLLSIRQAAEYLGCSTDRMRRRVNRREIGFVQDGPRGDIKFRACDLDKWSQAHYVAEVR